MLLVRRRFLPLTPPSDHYHCTRIEHGASLELKTDNLCLAALSVVSGQTPEVPVVSKKSGHLYEKRLVVKYIDAEGKVSKGVHGGRRGDCVLVNMLKLVTEIRLGVRGCWGLLDMSRSRVGWTKGD